MAPPDRPLEPLPDDAPVVSILAPIKAWGGIEGKLVTLGREFLRHGVVPELVQLRGGQVPYPERLPSGFLTHDLHTRSKLDGVPAVARYLRLRQPAAVLTAKDHAAQVGLLARSWGRVSVPVCVKVTNTLSLVARRRGQRFMIRRLYPRADRVIPNSQGVADDLVSHFGIPPDRITIIHNPTVTEDFSERAAHPVEHPWLAVDRDIPVIMGVGRFTPQKDFPTLVEAFARVRAQRPARLMLVGEGPERSAIEARARALGVSDDVALPGAVPDALPYLARASLFVLSSRYEGLSNVLIEALAVGTPAVSTDCPSGSAEILGDGRFGRLVPLGDTVGLADAMAAELDAPTPWTRLAEAVERFRAAPVARQYLRAMGLESGDG